MILDHNGNPITGRQFKDGGGAASSMAELPGFGLIPKGNNKTYLEMSGHPTLAIVRTIVTGPIRRNKWTWEKKKDAPQQLLDLCKDTLDGLRSGMMREALRALEFEWTPFEKVWQRRNGEKIVAELKPLARQNTDILIDRDTGDLLGLENKAVGQDNPVRLSMLQSFFWRYDDSTDFPRGRARHENVRKDWARSEQVNERMAQYLKKVSGILLQLHYPDGTSKDAAGADRPNFWIAKQLIDDVTSGKSVALVNKFASFLSGESGSVTPAMLEKALAAAGSSDWVFSFLDPGATDFTGGFLDALAYYDKLLFRGWLRPERAGLEATKGGIGQGDSREHKDASVCDSELIDQEITTAFNKSVVDDVLEQKAGPQARGTVWAESSPLDDNSLDNSVKLLTIALGNPTLAPLIWAKVNDASILEDVGVPVSDTINQAVIAAATAPPQTQAMALMSRMIGYLDEPSGNGNGRH